jgi:NADH-quinone oxidoreductase subunit J
VRNVGNILFTSYNLPFQVVGVLLLVATIGVVILSKRELK